MGMRAGSLYYPLGHGDVKGRLAHVDFHDVGKVRVCVLRDYGKSKYICTLLIGLCAFLCFMKAAQYTQYILFSFTSSGSCLHPYIFSFSPCMHMFIYLIIYL